MKVDLKRTGRLTLIEPLPRELRSALTFRLTPSIMERGQLKIKSEYQTFCKEDPEKKGRFVFPAGFTYRVCKKLESLGIQYDYEDIRGLDIERPDLSRLPDLHQWQGEALSRVFSSPCGIVWVATAAGKTFLIKQIVRAFRNTTIVVSSHASPPLVSLYKDLRKEFGGDVAGLGVVGPHSEPARVTICHVRSLLHAPIDRCGMLLYDEVHGAGAPETSKTLANVAFANMYGFTASAQGRMDSAEPIIEALFGPVIYRLSHKDAVDFGLVSKINVHIYTVSGPWVMDEKFTDRVYNGIVANAARNRAVAEVARNHYADKRVVILAHDNLEHVFRLKKLLPDYTPVYAADSMTNARYRYLRDRGWIPPDYKRLWPGAQHAIADKFRRGEITKVISTSVWDTGIDLPDLQVLIRADGRPGLIQAIQTPGRVARKKEEGGVLVDFFDDLGPIMTKRSRKRIEHYKKIGYNVERRSRS